MLLHDEIASIVALARNVRDGLSGEKSTINTATLKLLLDTLIDLGASPFGRRVAEDAQRAVAGQMVSLQKAKEAAEKVFQAEATLAETRFNGRS
jgi:hypothetical protein